MTREDLEIIEALLVENGIKCELHELSLAVTPGDDSFRRLYLFCSGERYASRCRRPDIADPNFIEDTKDLIKRCPGNCVKCYRNMNDE